ncbi:hypothetical protein [Herbiconiux sp. UC225_62]|uniref:hypothetical protein n=1 Tax=Herbiconiux sp. UC225_62 TaxID=3350168 RepID=UPI0036D2D15F
MSKFETVLGGWAEAQAAIDVAQDALIAHLDFDTPLMCEVVESKANPIPCRRAADWMARMTCCGWTVLMCNEDKVRKVAQSVSVQGRWICSRCNARMKSFDEAVEFIPIGGRS